MYSRISGPSPLSTILRHRARITDVEVGERREHAWPCSGSRGWSFSGDLGDERERALGPDDQLGEVVAGATPSTNLPPVRMTSPVGSTACEAEHVVAGDAVLDRPHAAGVGGDVAAEARATARPGRPGRRGRRRRSCSSSSVSVTPGLHDGHVVVGVDLEDPVHPLERDQRCRRDAGRARRTGRVPLPRAVTGVPVLGGELEDRRDLVGAARPHHVRGLLRRGAPSASSWV